MSRGHELFDEMVEAMRVAIEADRVEEAARTTAAEVRATAQRAWERVFDIQKVMNEQARTILAANPSSSGEQS